MGTLVNALESLFKFFVIVIISVLTMAFLVVADIVALVVYPIWAWKNPFEASNADFLSEVLGWSVLYDIVNPRKHYPCNKFMEFFRYFMRPLDAVVIRLWNAWFLAHSPMKKRRYFIDRLGNQLQKLPEKVQEKYFYEVDFDRKVYLLQRNMLSPSVIELLNKKEFVRKEGNLCYAGGNINAFIHAGKITDADFQNLLLEDVKTFSEKFDLSLNKQCHLIRQAFKLSDYVAVLRAYIMRKGLHPSAVKLFYDLYGGKKHEDKAITSIPVALQCRQDLVTVQQTIANCHHSTDCGVFSKYLKQRGKLGYEAQLAMLPWQYELFHKAGLKLTPNAVYEKLAKVNKNNDTIRFVELMMKYGEIDGNDIAMHQIAGDEKLSAMWLEHLSKAA